MINVAIDGPAGAGKSTVAKAVAKQLGLIYLDTGAMYRATAYFAISRGVDVKDADGVSRLLDEIEMDIRYENGVQQIYVNGINTTPYLREHYMSKAASDISALPPVRYKMVELQRNFAAGHDVVLDGRDIGTFVLPNANCKLFLTATPEERADRRFKELTEKGQQVDRDELLKDIIQRDYNDSHREVAPLKQAEDAEYLDTTNMSLDEVIRYVTAKVQKVLAECGNGDKAANERALEQENKPAVSDENAPAPMKKRAKNESKTKKYYQPPKSFAFFRFIRALLHPIQAVVWPTKIVNKENAEKIDANAIFICNHYTKADTFLPCVALFKREAHILAKYELFENPVSGWFLHKMGAIPVRRGEADIDCVKYVLKILKDKKQLLIFPEGTRNKQGTEEMAEFKQGTARFAIKTRSPIVPMMYYAPPKAFKKNWLYVGEPFTLEEFYGAKTADIMQQATDVIRDKMQLTRQLVNEYVAELKKEKK